MVNFNPQRGVEGLKIRYCSETIVSETLVKIAPFGSGSFVHIIAILRRAFESNLRFPEQLLFFQTLFPNFSYKIWNTMFLISIKIYNFSSYNFSIYYMHEKFTAYFLLQKKTFCNSISTPFRGRTSVIFLLEC